MRIDLHTHSTASDGTQDPAQVMHAAAQAGLAVVALTDHDTTSGWDAARRVVAQTGVALVPGTELSTQLGGISVHLLSYLHDPDDPALRDIFSRSQDSRADRAARMVDRIARDYPLTWAEVSEGVEAGATIGRPHIADALVARGYVRDRDEAFRRILHPQGGYYRTHWAPTTAAAITAVRDAGGVPVLAHPWAMSRGAIIGREQLVALADAGLAGVEAEHPDHDEAQRQQLRDLAGDLGLFVTGSSDYHGAGKVNRLGQCLTGPAVLQQIAEAGRLPVIGL
ncbi:MAG: PHP domain-containing protein [Beutenbergiaceae bacterium]